MTFFRSSRYARCIAVSLIVAIYLIPGMCIPAFAQTVAAARKTMVVFPFDKPAEGTPENLGLDFADAVKASLSADRSLIVLTYNERLPSVHRAATVDGTLKKEDTAGPFGTEKEQRDKAAKIGAIMAADMVLVGTIDEYKYDEAKKQAVISATAELIDAKTGKSLKISAARGVSPENSKDTTEEGLAALAAGDAVSKLTSQISTEAKPYDPTQPQTTTVVLDQPTKKKSSLKKYLLPLLLIVGVGLAVSGGGGGSDSDGGGPIGPPR